METNFVQSTKSYIAKGDIHKAIHKLEEQSGMFFPIIRFQLLLLKSRLIRMEQANHSGVLSYEDLNIHKNKITIDLIYLLDRMMEKRKTQYIHWLLWSIAVVCSGMFFYGKTVNTQGLKVESPVISDNKIIYTFHKLESAYNKYDLYINIPEKEKELSLKPHIKLVKEDGGLVEAKELLIGNVMLWKKSQGLKIHFPERKGTFQLIVPIANKEKVSSTNLKNALTIKSNDTDSRSGYEVFQWHHNLVSNFWDWLIKMGAISSIVISIVGRYLLKI